MRTFKLALAIVALVVAAAACGPCKPVPPSERLCDKQGKCYDVNWVDYESWGNCAQGGVGFATATTPVICGSFTVEELPEK